MSMRMSLSPPGPAYGVTARSRSARATPTAGGERILKGKCPVCTEGVYSDQPRVLNNGSYHHEKCLAATVAGTTPKRDGAEKTAPSSTTPVSGTKPVSSASRGRVHRGDCPKCGKGVYSDQPRTSEGGFYFHEECLAATKSASNGQGTAVLPKSKQSPAGTALPRVRKGDCPECGKGVFADQLRVVENGMYYHEDCLAASKARTATSKEEKAAPPALAAEGRSLRGVCPQCGKGVYSDQLRTSEGGSYYHQDCLKRRQTEDVKTITGIAAIESMTHQDEDIEGAATEALARALAAMQVVEKSVQKDQHTKEEMRLEAGQAERAVGEIQKVEETSKRNPAVAQQQVDEEDEKREVMLQKRRQKEARRRLQAEIKKKEDEARKRQMAESTPSNDTAEGQLHGQEEGQQDDDKLWAEEQKRRKQEFDALAAAAKELNRSQAKGKRRSKDDAKQFTSTGTERISAGPRAEGAQLESEGEEAQEERRLRRKAERKGRKEAEARSSRHGCVRVPPGEEASETGLTEELLGAKERVRLLEQENQLQELRHREEELRLQKQEQQFVEEELAARRAALDLRSSEEPKTAKLGLHSGSENDVHVVSNPAPSSTSASQVLSPPPQDPATEVVPKAVAKGLDLASDAEMSSKLRESTLEWLQSITQETELLLQDSRAGNGEWARRGSILQDSLELLVMWQQTSDMFRECVRSLPLAETQNSRRNKLVQTSPRMHHGRGLLTVERELEECKFALETAAQKLAEAESTSRRGLEQLRKSEEREQKLAQELNQTRVLLESANREREARHFGALSVSAIEEEKDSVALDSAPVGAENMLHGARAETKEIPCEDKHLEGRQTELEIQQLHAEVAQLQEELAQVYEELCEARLQVQKLENAHNNHSQNAFGIAQLSKIQRVSKIGEQLLSSEVFISFCLLTLCPLMILALFAGETQTDVRHAHTCTDDSSATGGVVQGARLVDRGRQLPSRSRSARGKRGRYTGDGRSGCPGLQYLHREATLHERDELITANDAHRT